MLVSHKLGVAIGLGWLLVQSAVATTVPVLSNGLSSAEIIERAVKRTEQCQSRAESTGYSYRKVSITEELDPAGRVRERKERVYEVSIQAGTTSVRLLSVNGHTPAATDLKKQGENDTNVRQLLGTSEGNKSLQGQGDGFLTEELASRYSFTLLNEEPVNGRSSYKIAFRPKTPEPAVHHLIDRFLDHLSGTLWVDKEEFEIARADIQLGSEVDLLGGVVGCLRKLAYTVTRTRVGDGLWFNSSSNGDFEGRKLLERMRIKMRSQTTNIRTLAANN